MITGYIKLIFLCALVFLCSCHSPVEPHRGWYILKWVEKTNPDALPQDVSDETLTRFNLIMQFHQIRDKEKFSNLISGLKEGDVLAYYKTRNESRKSLLKGKLQSFSYNMFGYGHLAVVVQDPRHAGKLRLFSAQSIKGPNIDDDLQSLKKHNWHVFRLDKWQKINLREFVRLSIRKKYKGHAYDFSGMFGFWNAKLDPQKPEEIGHEYICSTSVLAAYYYAGVHLNAQADDHHLN